MARSEFDHRPGTCKPLNLDEDALSGDKATAYRMLKHIGYAPPESELLKEIRRENERIAQQLNRLRSQARDLRSRRVPPFTSEKRAYIEAIETVITGYEEKVHALNHKILTYHLSVPTPMHLS